MDKGIIPAQKGDIQDMTWCGKGQEDKVDLALVGVRLCAIADI
jgi:hypothetical protein